MHQKLLLPGITLIILLFTFFHFFPVNADQKGHQPPAPEPQQKTGGTAQASQPKIQVVFALDATGSMSGLIDAAKEKIWSIASSLAQAEPSPIIEMGLVFYRDRGDVFVTRLIPLSKDMDAVYEQLMQMSADGGGDSPESVNQALHEAVTKFTWDSALSTYKTVFLVGDCPPHMNYSNDVKYPVSCNKAKQKDIVLNTILMGNDYLAAKIWKDIANCKQGSFTQVNMNANDIQIYTPYDSAIAVLSDQLDDTRLYYGNEKEKFISSEKMSKTKNITQSAKMNVKAQRAEYNFTKAGKTSYYGDKELLEEYKENKVSLENIKKEELPVEMRNMTSDEKTKFVQQKITTRDSINKALQQLTKLRTAFIEKDLSNRKAEEVEGSFTNKIYKSIQQQTEKKNIRLKDKAKY